jgi:S-adenosylmethionine decarboxylase
VPRNLFDKEVSISVVDITRGHHSAITTITIRSYTLFFEGSEKKAEIIVAADKINLLNDITDTFWQHMVQHAKAQILSSISNKHCKAFLLSESSLFIWSDRLLIITCGTTRLVNAVEFFLKQQAPENIRQVIYQRKNEYFAHSQPTNILDDVTILNDFHPGSTYRFGELDSHHGYLFSMDVDFKAEDNDKTYELLIYQIDQDAVQALTREGLSNTAIFTYLKLDQILAGFTIDDYVFEPFGYSLNAISDNGDYFTVHVTPQANSSYISVESNLDLVEHLGLFLDTLNPASFDLMTYNDEDFQEKLSEHVPGHYVPKEQVAFRLDSDYEVRFASFIRPQNSFTSPTKISITTQDGETHYVL